MFTELLRKLCAYLVMMTLYAGVGMIVLTIVFCVLFDMNRGAADYDYHAGLMRMIGMFVFPLLLIAGAIHGSVIVEE